MVGYERYEDGWCKWNFGLNGLISLVEGEEEDNSNSSNHITKLRFFLSKKLNLKYQLSPH